MLVFLWHVVSEIHVHFCTKKLLQYKAQKRDELYQSDIIFISRILWHRRFTRSLKEPRIHYLILTGLFPLLSSLRTTISMKSANFHVEKLLTTNVGSQQQTRSSNNIPAKFIINHVTQILRNNIARLYLFTY